MAKQVSYKIKMKDGEEKEVTGIVINERWGIDKRQYETTRTNKNGESKTTLSSYFCLTHILGCFAFVGLHDAPLDGCRCL